MLRNFVILYLLNAIFAFRIKGNFEVNLNKWVNLLFVANLNLLFEKVFKLESVSEKLNVIPVIGQIITIIIFGILPIVFKILIQFIPVSITYIYIYNFIFNNVIVYILILAIDFFVYQIKSKRTL